MNTKKWKIGATGATLGALLFVTVYEGKVLLANGDRQISLTQGEAGRIGADGVPVRVDPSATSPNMIGASPPASPTRAAARRLSPDQQQLRERVLESRQKQKAPQTAAPAPGATLPPATGAPESRDGTMADRTGKLGDVVKILNHELAPMVDHCYQDALEQNPRLHGMLALHVKVASVEGVGSIFETVEPDATNQVSDADFIDCVRQSAFSIDLPPPKADAAKDFLLTMPFGADAGTH